MEKQQLISLADITTAHRVRKSEFFAQINTLLDWNPVEKLLHKYYRKGKSATGRESYPALLLFKMTLLQTWYGLSDYELEDQVNDRISFSRFVGIPLDATVPDHSVICRFRGELNKRNGYEKLFTEINRQLEQHNILVRTGVIVDASITDSPRRPRGKQEYDVVKDREEDAVEEGVTVKENTVKLIKKVQPNVDPEAAWIEKRGVFRFGYKLHEGVDPNGLILGVHTTPANESDIRNLEPVLDKIELEPRATVECDKGYKSAYNDGVIAKRGLRNRIMFRNVKGRKITHWQGVFNKLVSRTRYKVERTFGSMRRWFGSGTARYVGLAKTHSQHLLEAMAHNLYRAPRVIVSTTEK
ncbi:MAG: IS5 family transposase [Rikenellaceae bacterium]